MKRIKSVNGYTIYEATSARDEANYNCHVGSYNIYISSDIRDFGLPNSYPEYEDIDSLSVAEAMCGASQYAVACDLAEEISGSTAQDMDLVLEIERRLEAGEALETVRASFEEALELGHYPDEDIFGEDDEPEQAQNSAEQALIDLFDLELEDDGSPYGGIAFAGETVRDFVLENGIHTVDELNSALAESHIRTVVGEPEEDEDATCVYLRDLYEISPQAHVFIVTRADVYDLRITSSREYTGGKEDGDKIVWRVTPASYPMYKNVLEVEII